MSSNGEIPPDSAIVRVDVRPETLEDPAECTKWQRFLAILVPGLKRSRHLTNLYAKARVDKEMAQAKKILEEAAEIAARTNLTRQQEAKEFNALVDDIFATNGSPPSAKMLKFTKLIQSNPEIAEQTEKINYLVEKLTMTRGLLLDIVKAQKQPRQCSSGIENITDSFDNTRAPATDSERDEEVAID